MKLYVVWSKTFNNLVGVYSDEFLAKKLAMTQAGEVIETELDHIHPGHAKTLRELCSILIESEATIEFASSRKIDRELEPIFEAHALKILDTPIPI